MNLRELGEMVDRLEKNECPPTNRIELWVDPRMNGGSHIVNLDPSNGRWTLGTYDGVWDWADDGPDGFVTVEMVWEPYTGKERPRAREETNPMKSVGRVGLALGGVALVSVGALWLLRRKRKATR